MRPTDLTLLPVWTFASRVCHTDPRVPAFFLSETRELIHHDPALASPRHRYAYLCGARINPHYYHDSTERTLGLSLTSGPLIPASLIAQPPPEKKAAKAGKLPLTASMALITATWNSNELAVCLQRQCPLHAFRVLPTTCGASENQCANPLHLLVLLTAPFSVPAPEPSCGVVKLDPAEYSYWTLVCYLHMLICTQEPGSSPGRLSQIPILGYTLLS